MLAFSPNLRSVEDFEPQVLDTALGQIIIDKDHIIMTANPEVEISIKTGIFILLDVVKKVGTRPVVYISNRINCYSLDPNDYKYLEMVPNLKGIAIVAYNEIIRDRALLEERFFRKPFKAFSDLTEAKEWASAVVDGRVIV